MKLSITPECVIDYLVKLVLVSSLFNTYSSYTAWPLRGPVNGGRILL